MNSSPSDASDPPLQAPTWSESGTDLLLRWDGSTYTGYRRRRPAWIRAAAWFAGITWFLAGTGLGLIFAFFGLFWSAWEGTSPYAPPIMLLSAVTSVAIGMSVAGVCLLAGGKWAKLTQLQAGASPGPFVRRWPDYVALTAAGLSAAVLAIEIVGGILSSTAGR